MFQTSPKPVTLFKSTDEGAPQLADTAGSLLTVLKACLVTGYGGKQPLGWEILFESPAAAVFRSRDETSNRHCLQVRNDNGRYINVAGFAHMDGLESGNGRFAYDNHYDRFAYVYYDGRPAPKWWLIGHGKAFVLLLADPDGYQGNRCAMLYFGDVPSIVPQDGGNTVLLHNLGNNEYFTVHELVWAGLGGNKDALFAKTWAQEERQAQAVLVSVAANGSSDAPYPDVISGGTLAAESYLYERVSGKAHLRGLLAGVLKAQNDLSALADGAPVPLDGVADTLLKFNLGGNADHVLINAGHWEAV